jgi:uncharacterized membrane protein
MRSTPRWIFTYAVLLVALGAAFRFTNLERKFYTNDEATTSLHVAGHTIADYAATVFDGRPRTVRELAVFQTTDPGRSEADIVRGLAREDPQHPPLFYLLDREWMRAFGTSVGARRALSALFGTLALLAAGWLGWELFDLPAGLFAAGLLAVSPFNLIYAQQAREYALWTLLAIVATALLARALRTGSRGVWAAYACAVALGAYADALFLYVVAAHGLAVAFTQRGRVGGPLGWYLAATAAGLLAFSPWLAILLAGARHGLVVNNAYLAAPVGLKTFALKWIFNAGTVFYDADYVAPASALVLLPIFAFVAVGFAVLVRRGPRSSAAIVACLAALPAATFLAFDLLQHESRSTSARYLIPVWLALELATAYGLSRLAASPRPRKRWSAAAAAVFLAACGIVSCAISSGAVAWWGSDGSSAALARIAPEIDAFGAPLVVVREPERWDFAVAQLVNVLRPDVRFVQYRMEIAPTPPAGAGTTLVLDPSATFQRALRERGYRLRLLDDGAARGPAALRALRSQAARERARTGYAEGRPSLWRLEAP